MVSESKIARSSIIELDNSEAKLISEEYSEGLYELLG